MFYFRLKMGKILINIIIVLIFFLGGCSDNKGDFNSNKNDKFVEEKESDSYSMGIDNYLQDSLELLTNYQNQRYGFSFDIPKKWEGKYEVIEDGNKILFYYTGCPGKKIELFTIVAWDEKDYNKLKEDELFHTDVHILGKRDNLVFEEILPIDISFNENETEKYSEEYILMTIPIEEIHRRFHIQN